jgi:hypothetical protein
VHRTGLRPAIQAAFCQVWRDHGQELGQAAPPVTLTVRRFLRVMYKKLSILIIAGLILISCSPSDIDPIDPPIDFNQAYLNQQIKLVVVRELSALKTDQDVAVLLEYDTPNKVVFPSDYNLRIFIRHDSGWLETEEKPTIRPDGQVVLSPHIPSSYGQIVAFWPQLPDITKTYNIRIYVFGDMNMKEGTEKVAAYTDLILSP